MGGPWLPKASTAPGDHIEAACPRNQEPRLKQIVDYRL